MIAATLHLQGTDPVAQEGVILLLAGLLLALQDHTSQVHVVQEVVPVLQEDHLLREEDSFINRCNAILQF
jgi:hypothetical protein